MKVTSAELAKLIRKLETNKEQVRAEERNVETYNAAVGEDEKALAPEYIFAETQQTIDTIDQQIMKLKHALNMFNCTTEVVDGMTVDQVLIRLPQLATKKRKLSTMMSRPQKRRSGITGSVIDYVYASYDPQEALDEYAKVDDEITKLQLALDHVNMTVEFEV